MLENKLGIMDSAELAREEERLSKKRAKELFESFPRYRKFTKFFLLIFIRSRANCGP